MKKFFVLLVIVAIVFIVAIILGKEYWILPNNDSLASDEVSSNNGVLNNSIPDEETAIDETTDSDEVILNMSIKTNPISMPYFISEAGGLYKRESELDKDTFLEINVEIKRIIDDGANIYALSTRSDDYSKFIFVIKTDGSVWQLVEKEDSDNSQYYLEKVNGIENCVKVNSGYEHVMALTADGHVYTWGNNTYGQLGSADDIYRETPEKVQGLSGINDISSGSTHCMALSTDGKVFTWGDNSEGQLGNGSYASNEEERKQSSVYQVDGLSEIIQVSAAWDTSIALQNDGTVFVWGSSASANIFCRPTPTQQRLKDIVQISSYGLCMMGLSSTGEVWIWGVRIFAPSEGMDPPYKAADFPGAVKIIAGEKNIVITDDQEIWYGIIGKVEGNDRSYYYDAEFVCMLSNEDVQKYGLRLCEELDKNTDEYDGSSDWIVYKEDGSFCLDMERR